MHSSLPLSFHSFLSKAFRLVARTSRGAFSPQSRLHSLDKQLPHPLEQDNQLPRLIDALEHPVDLLALELRAAVAHVVVARGGRELEPGLAVPVAVVEVRVDELEAVGLARALDLQAQVRDPEVELGHVEAGLALDARRVRPLRRQPPLDLPLRLRDLLRERVPRRHVPVPLLAQLRDRRLHLALLRRLPRDRLLVRVRLVLQDLHVLLLHALVLCMCETNDRISIFGPSARPSTCFFQPSIVLQYVRCLFFFLFAYLVVQRHSCGTGCAPPKPAFCLAR